MAKTHKNLFEKVVSYQNLFLAFRKTKIGKSYQKEALRFNYNLPIELLNLQKELKKERYQFGPYKEFTICDSKERMIKAPPFRDRVVHHAICNVIEPIFDKSFIYDSYACRKNKGSHRAVKRVKKFIWAIGDDSFCAKIDISKYFPSVNHQKLLSLLEKKINDEKLLRLLWKLIRSSETGSEFDNLFSPDSPYFHHGPKGIPIGNLTSQLFANVYLNELDQFVKHKLKIKYYIRYMDDFLIFKKSKKELHSLIKEIRDFVSNNLYLDLHPRKIRVFPLKNGVDFCGYVIFKNYIKLRGKTVRRIKKKFFRLQKKFKKGEVSFERYIAAINAWQGFMQHGKTYQLQRKLFGDDLFF
ncbi:group II intron reverse transcriptase domain-containing protein [bacterium]|nr:group II intron reverse transcriptase domain-containing protein [bacterium]